MSKDTSVLALFIKVDCYYSSLSVFCTVCITLLFPAHTFSMKTLFIKLSKFITCGAFGWCLECFWTGLHSIQKRNDKRLMCQTSVWMFPIYSMAAFIEPMGKLMKGKSFLFRGSIYTVCIYTMEFFTGTLLKKHHACPWDYSAAKTNINGVIRLDFAPLWFLTGLAYERLLGIK